MKISQQQINFFRHNGFLKLPEKIPPKLIKDLKHSLSSEFVHPTKPFYKDSEGETVKIADLYGRGSPFTDLISSKTILDPMENLLGPNIIFTRNRHNHATLNASGANVPRLHRDVLQWSRTLISLVVYLEEATVENGCTYLIPGSHLFPYVGTPNDGGTWMDEHSVYEDLIEQAIPVPMPEGGVLIFDGLVFHTVGPNKSGLPRPSIALGYHSVDELEEYGESKQKILVKGEKLYRGNDLKTKM